MSCCVHAVCLQVCVLPLASPCARCGTPEVRLWPCLVPSMLFVFKSVSCHWQARAPAVERPRCAFGRVLFRPCCLSSSLCLATGKPVRPLWNARGAPLAVSCSVCLQVCVLPLASPCARCGTPEVRLWPCLVPSMLFLFKSVSCHWQARAPAVERPRCAFGRVLFRPCCFSSSLCLATGKPVRPLWNARGAPLACCSQSGLPAIRSACYVPLLNRFFREFVCFVEFVVKPV